MTFVQIFSQICSLDKSMLVAKSQSQITENCIVMGKDMFSFKQRIH